MVVGREITERLKMRCRASILYRCAPTSDGAPSQWLPAVIGQPLAWGSSRGRAVVSKNFKRRHSADHG